MSDPYSEKNWVRTGLVFAAVFMILFAFVQPLIDREPFSWFHVVMAVPFGLGYSFLRGTSKDGKPEPKGHNET